MIKTSKNVYDKAESSDGDRILVMRMWPRGISKEKLKIVDWKKELGTEPELIKEWKQGKLSWPELAKAYRASLKKKEPILKELAEQAKKKTITLLCSCKDEHHCHRTLLKEAIERFT